MSTVSNQWWIYIISKNRISFICVTSQLLRNQKVEWKLDMVSLSNFKSDFTFFSTHITPLSMFVPMVNNFKPTITFVYYIIKVKIHLVAKLSPTFRQRWQQLSKWARLWTKHVWYEPSPRFCESHCCKVCLPNSIKKAKESSLLILGLLRATKMIERYDVFPA